MEQLKKELLYKSVHRGCKETDILLGEFATACIDKMSFDELHDYKEIIEMPDNDIYDWLTDKVPTPTNFNLDIINNIKQFHAQSHS